MAVMMDDQRMFNMIYEAADTIMLGPLVQSIDARDAATDQGGGR